MVYAVDGVAFPVRPDAYTSVSSDQVVTGAQRTVGPGAQMTKELLAEKLTITCQVDVPHTRSISPHQTDADRSEFCPPAVL